LIRILLRGNVLSIEVKRSQEMESERDLIGCKAENIAMRLFQGLVFDYVSNRC
jgi:hypothetical protein